MAETEHDASTAGKGKVKVAVSRADDAVRAADIVFSSAGRQKETPLISRVQDMISRKTSKIVQLSCVLPGFSPLFDTDFRGVE
jgi:hypothetical protein